MGDGMMNILSIAFRRAGATMLLGAALALSGCGGPGDPPPAKAPLEGARVGGPFTLTDHTGAERRDSDFAGQYRLMYFGYSYCPDVCPIDMQKLMQGLAQFERSDPARGARVVPMFITVDPERDTPEALAPFVARYHPRLIGLTGAPDVIGAVAKSFLVTAIKQEGSAPDAYLIAHTQLAYLMDGAGKPVALLPIDDPRTDTDEGAPALVAAALDKWVR